MFPISFIGAKISVNQKVFPQSDQEHKPLCDRSDNSEWSDSEGTAVVKLVFDMIKLYIFVVSAQSNDLGFNSKTADMKNHWCLSVVTNI
ncbi:hypothetical protein [Nostoc sp.]|uniref:hypothetical protein n=1 Tax=Nostoc sp. TaxID=1180 RepID=UPI002FF9F859